MTSTGIAVVGGGIVGASIAYHLSERTSDPIVVYERGELASETTKKATAMIGVSGPDPYYRMQEYGFRLYNEFFADPSANPSYRQCGRLRVATTPDEAQKLSNIASQVRDTSATAAPKDGDASSYANSLVSYVQGEKLHDRFLLPPVAADRVEGALYRPQYGYIQDESRTLGPRELALEFVERARANGVRFETDTAVTDVLVEDDSVTGLEVDGSTTVEAHAVVCAAGPWSDTLAAAAGIDVPIEHYRSPVFALELDDPLPFSLPMLKYHEASVGIHPKRDDRVLLTYTPDTEEPSPTRPSTNVNDLPDEYRESARRNAEHLLPLLGDAAFTDQWVGIGTTTPDGFPIVGWTAIEGLSLAATTSGIQYAPAVGSIVARQLVDGDPTEYYDAVSIARFDGYTDTRRE